jgi:aminoglycoside 3-N-acetyltransferase
MSAVSAADIRAGFDRLGVAGRPVVVHASLRSFGAVEGGADTVVQSLVASFPTVLMPAFCFDSVAPPLPGDRPSRNGCDYAYYDNWSRPFKPFVVEEAGIDLRMGIASRTLRDLPGTRRSGHPWHSWLAHGDGAEELTSDHPWDTTNLPLDRLVERDGWVLLLGVGLASCTAVHVAEEWAGRRPFIRWAYDRAGEVKRIRVAGCSKGFENLWPHCADLWAEARVGTCVMRATPLRYLLPRLVEALRFHPDVVRCSSECLRCRDGALGGAGE